ncbi:MAG: hypothetical protein CM1200mP10_09190 [Candidatus Neomarinimicrobiota bacterium]|nr:MAG: hypothetical protein CM1200mP10_09190 [Candidatus Neomarinimicrobiota bacterium]
MMVIRLNGFNEFIDLSAYAYEPEVSVRFILKSDGSVEEDGFYFDDINIKDIKIFQG